MTDELKDLILDGLEDDYEQITSVEAVLLSEDEDEEKTTEMPLMQLVQLQEQCRGDDDVRKLIEWARDLESR